MAKTKPKHTTASTYYALFGFMSAVYVLMTFIAPIQDNRFDLSNAATHLIQVSFVIPIIVIWFLAVFGAVRFKSYANLIHGSDDGAALNSIANGLLLMSFGALASGLFSLTRSYLVTDDAIRTFTIISNYFGLTIQVATYVLLLTGSNQLLDVVGPVPARAYSKRVVPILGIILVAVSIYTSFIFLNQHRNSSPDPVNTASFFLSDAMILFTIVIPYAIIWGMSALTIVNLRTYQQHVKGIIYRSVFGSLAAGLTAVLSLAVALSILTNLSESLAHASLTTILILLYVILLAYAVGFIIIAKGARRLAQLEEV